MNAREEQVAILIVMITLALLLAIVPWVSRGMAFARAALEDAQNPQTREAALDGMTDARYFFDTAEHA